LSRATTQRRARQRRASQPRIQEGGKLNGAGNIKATREDWLNAALERLISDGIASVRILPLSQGLGVSRSSFYWYFKSRSDLLDQLLAFWREKNTRFIVEHARLPAANITCGVINIFKCWVDESLFDPRLDFAIRSWALLSKKVRKIIRQADEERVAAICEMFQRHGYEAEDAFIRARVLYFTQIGYYALDLREPMESRLSHVPAYLRSSTGYEPDPRDVVDFRRYVAQNIARSAGRARRANWSSLGAPTLINPD
jgi:AcrR family transcriptional regulator